MARQRPPAMPLYAGDWKVRTAGLSAAARGCNLELLLYCWHHQTPLPLDSESRRRIAICPPADWPSVWGELTHLWTETERGWREIEVEKGWRKYRRFRQMQSDKGKLSAASRRATKLEPNAQPTFDQFATDEGTEPATSHEPESQPKPQPPGNQKDDPDPRSRSRAVQISGAAPPGTPEGPNVRVLTRLAHDVLDARDQGKLSDVDVAETLKTAAARHRLSYDATAVRKAIESAEFQRARTAPAEAARDPRDTAMWLLAQIVAKSDGEVLIEKLPSYVLEAALMEWPNEPDFRDRVVGLAWRRETWHATPELEVDEPAGVVRLVGEMA